MRSGEFAGTVVWDVQLGAGHHGGDTQTSYQILAGFDYPVSETVSVGLRARWMRSGTAG